MINLKLAEKIFISILAFSILLSAFGKGFIDNEYLSSLLVVSISCVMVFFIIPLVIKNNIAKFLIFIFFCIRLVLLYLDYYGKDLATILHSGGDSERFYEWGLYISKDFSRMEEISYTIYTDFLGVLYWVIGDQRFFSQFLNVILGMWSIFVFFKILDLFKLKDSKKFFFLVLYGLYPQNIIFSSILLREAIIQFLFIYSILFFTKWLMKNNRVDLYKTLFFVLLSSVFHSGMLFSLFVYGFIFLFLDLKKYKLNFSFKRKTLFVFCCGIAVILIAYNMSFLNSKFSFLLPDSNSSFIEKYDARVGVELGGASYLIDYKINSVVDLITLAPLKLFYFIFSPMPYDVRGGSDLVAIIFDSSFYYFLFFSVLRGRKKIKGSVFRIFPNVFFTLFLIMALVFALGTENSGTAMRHRSKILPTLLLALVFIDTIKQNRLYIWNDKKND
ncbi:MAG: hypothetical protein ACI8ZX_001083 [Planctomycetota bacterium]|jgi:hypothetical protein